MHASAADKKKTTILSVGTIQAVDSFNTTVGVTVASYEVWNLQYATLTDKAADDFDNDPRPGRELEGVRRRAAPTPTRSATA